VQNEIKEAVSSLSQWWEDAGIEVVPLPIPASKKSQNSNNKAPAKPDTSHRIKSTKTNSASKDDRIAQAKTIAAACQTLDDLTAAIRSFNAGQLSLAASQAVIARGNSKARIMLIGEAPGRDEDKAGKPFVGKSGQFLDKMFASIGLDETTLYITNAVFWRPKGNRTPTPDESDICLPFVERHIALIKPEVLITIGGSSTKTLLGADTGITRLRGSWAQFSIKNPDGSDSGVTIPLLPMLHPAFVLRKPISKRECWQDLLSLRQKLN